MSACFTFGQFICGIIGAALIEYVCQDHSSTSYYTYAYYYNYYYGTSGSDEPCENVSRFEEHNDLPKWAINVMPFLQAPPFRSKVEESLIET